MHAPETHSCTPGLRVLLLPADHLIRPQRPGEETVQEERLAVGRPEPGEAPQRVMELAGRGDDPRRNGAGSGIRLEHARRGVAGRRSRSSCQGSAAARRERVPAPAPTLQPWAKPALVVSGIVRTGRSATTSRDRSGDALSTTSDIHPVESGQRLHTGSQLLAAVVRDDDDIHGHHLERITPRKRPSDAFDATSASSTPAREPVSPVRVIHAGWG